MSTMQKWLFWVFIPLFVIISLATLAAIFLGFGNLNERERFILVNGFLVETGIAVIALFYAAFNLSRLQAAKVRLNVPDPRALVGKKATVTVYKAATLLGTSEMLIVNDNGPYISLDLVAGSDSARVQVVTADNTSYVGSFAVGNYPVELNPEASGSGS